MPIVVVDCKDVMMAERTQHFHFAESILGGLVYSQNKTELKSAKPRNGNTELHLFRVRDRIRKCKACLLDT